MNNVQSLPDVPAEKPYCKTLLRLYNAGIVMGNDAYGTFRPDNSITRAEAAAIIERVALPSKRLNKTLLATESFGDAYYLVNDYSFRTSSSISTDGSAWNYDNRNRVLAMSNMPENIIDSYTDGKVELWRDMDDVASGHVTWSFVGSLSKAADGVWFKITDDENNELYALTTKDGRFWFNGNDTGLAVPDDALSFTVAANLDTNTALVYLSGGDLGTLAIADGVAGRVSIGSGVETTAGVTMTRCDIDKDYIVNERFDGEKLLGWNVAGTVEPAAYGISGLEEGKNVKLMPSSTLTKTFGKVIGTVVLEAYLCCPESGSGYISLTDGGTTVAAIEIRDNEIINGGGDSLRRHTNNVWQTLRIEADTANGKALYKVNGKNCGEFPLDAATVTVDGIAVGVTAGTGYLDNIKVFMLHEKDDYCPEPVPAPDTGYNVILNVCSIWRQGTHRGWEAVSAYPENEPTLGYYDEGLPEVADWEIKFMIENGINVEHVCWYAPNRLDAPIIRTSHSNALHDGFFHAKYSDKMKFMLLYENTGDVFDFEAFKEYVWKYWVEYYFTDPRYFTIDNKLVFSVYGLAEYRTVMGDTAAAKVWMEEQAKTLGFDGVLIFFCDKGGSDASTFNGIAACGGDAAYAYSWGQDGNTYDKSLTRLTKASSFDSVHVIPTVSVGFNDIGWTKIRKPLISLADHKNLLDYVKNTYLVKQENDWRAKTVVISTWNEYGEGTYIMPSKELHGFGYLENIAEVFAGQTDHTANCYPTETQKARLGHLYPDSQTQLFRFDKERDAATDPVKLVLGLAEYRPSFACYEEDGELYAVAEDYAGFFSFHNFFHEWSRKTGVLKLTTRNNTEFVFTVGSDKALVNGSEKALKKPIALKDGLPVLPMYFIYTEAGIDYEKDGTTVTAKLVDESYKELLANRKKYEYEFNIPNDSEALLRAMWICILRADFFRALLPTTILPVFMTHVSAFRD